jgi:hypothetical protein
MSGCGASSLPALAEMGMTIHAGEKPDAARTVRRTGMSLSHQRARPAGNAGALYMNEAFNKKSFDTCGLVSLLD